MPKVIKFLAGWNQYNPNDVAGFTDDLADRLIADKAAVLYTPSAPPPDVPPEGLPTGTPLRPVLEEARIAKEVIDVLINEGGIGTVEDLRVMSMDDLLRLPRIGEATARRIMKAVEE